MVEQGVMRDITNTSRQSEEDPDWQMKKRENFAVSLRKEKKKQILGEKRAQFKIRQVTRAEAIGYMNQFNDLHPAMTDRFTTTEDKHRLVMQKLSFETVQYQQV